MRKKILTKAMAAVMATAMIMSGISPIGLQAATTDPTMSAREIRNAELSRHAATQGMVLLENNDSVLPVKPGKVALFGPGAEKPIKGGTGSGDVNQRYVVSVTEGLKNAGFTITSQSFLDRWTKAYEKGKEEASGGDSISNLMDGDYVHPDELIKAQELVDAKEADTAIYVLSRRSGEGGDRKNEAGDYQLSETEKENLEVIGKNFKKVIVVINAGGVVDTSFMDEIKGLDSLVLMSNAGMESGNALADILTGKVTPSGKLADTWAKEYSDYPSSETFSLNDEDDKHEVYDDDIFVGYRYFDSFNVDPEYEFGYGMSYTDFDIDVNSVKADADTVDVNVTVTNTGKKYSGKEVVQVYFSAPEGDLDKPYQELAAYAKTDELAPGAKQTLTISYNTTEMSSYDTEKAAYVMEDGDYIVRVGNSSRNTKASAVISLDEDVITEQLSNQMTPEEEINAISNKGVDSYESETEAADLEKAEKIELKASSIKTENNASEFDDETVTTYTTDEEYEANDSLAYEEKVEVVAEKELKLQDVIDGKGTMEEFVAQMSVEELATLCEGIGFANFFGSPEPIVGAQSDTVDGAAGETVSDFVDKYGIPAIVLADGPAGIRINQEYTSYPSKEDAEKGENGVTMYQFCTAWPIGTLLAQTWDNDLIRQVGDAVGGEMAEMGVTTWLAPGMNIHRNPLCGRNFEYYSEDPYLTGMIATSETLGVQANPGVGVTLKHFAANNQEESRNTSNSVISERAFREIYLKGFEIAVKSSQPMAIMSSYNLINGTYAMNDYDLLEDITRGEWGYEGTVMTDWFSRGSDDLGMHAGNDLIMPGGNAEQIVGGIKDIDPVFDENGQVTYYKVSGWGDPYMATTWKEFNVSADGTKTVTAPITSGKEAAVDAEGYITVGGERLVLTPALDEADNVYVTTNEASISEDGTAIVYKGEYTDNNRIATGDVQKSAMRVLTTISNSYQMASLTYGDGKKAPCYNDIYPDVESFLNVAKETVSETKVGKVTTTKVTSPAKGKITVTFKTVKDAEKYQIKVAQNKEFKNAKTYTFAAKAGSVNTRSITGLQGGKTYYVKVNAVNKYGVKGESGNRKSVLVKDAAPAKVKTTKAVSPAKGTMKVTFNTVKGAKSYKVVYASNKNFKNSKSVTVAAKAGKTNTVTVKGLKKGTRYVKVCGISAGKVVGGSQNVKVVKVK